MNANKFYSLVKWPVLILANVLTIWCTYNFLTRYGGDTRAGMLRVALDTGIVVMLMKMGLKATCDAFTSKEKQRQAVLKAAKRAYEAFANTIYSKSKFVMSPWQTLMRHPQKDEELVLKATRRDLEEAWINATAAAREDS